MADIFSATNQTRNKVPTNTFSWTHTNNLTTDLGRITPFFCELVPPKSSLRIKPTVGMQFMPMAFPLQTRIKMRVAFFKYPLRALWKDYRDYIGNFRQDLEEPYIDFSANPPQTSSLSDYLGLPTTFAGQYGSVKDQTNFFNRFAPIDSYMDSGGVFPEEGDTLNFNVNIPYTGAGMTLGNIPNGIYKLATMLVPSSNYQQVTAINIGLEPQGQCFAYFVDRNNVILKKAETTATAIDIPAGTYQIVLAGSKSIITSGNGFHDTDIQIVNANTAEIRTDGGFSAFIVQCFVTFHSTKTSADGQPVALSDETSPYWGQLTNPSGIKIAAYAFRAYEGIYNSWFRDNRNNPYYLNGQIQYNKWIPTMEGGPDLISNYPLRYANWEKDQFTTAVQSPQQGVAPLVGITTYEDTVKLDDGTMRTVVKTAIVDEDGKAYQVGFDSDSDGLKGVSYRELGEDANLVRPTSLISLAQSGISINDLRNVNAYQRYLELNIRAGYSYKDIIEQRFDVNVRYSDLLMPEFLGGTSDWVDMRSVTQTVMREDNGSYADALGSQAGIAGIRRSTEDITVFCDEESIIMGVVVFTPVPVYSQILPKHFLYRELLDHFQPEFANIGFQPIRMQELCPVQQFNSDKSGLLNTFGYNRPWYEYCQKLDTAHGLFRTNLRNFIMNRVFDSAPALNQSFLLVDPEQVNDVFVVTETTDKIYGQVYIDCQAKLPIPRIAIPRLE